MRAAALATLALLLEPVAHGEVISGKSEANAQGFQFLGKFCYDHVAGSKGQPVQQMKLEVSMSLDDTMIHNDNRPGVGLNAKWYVLVYDDEHLWCERHDNATHKNICPLGCHDDGAVCSGTPTFIRGFEPVMDAVKDNNRRMCRADGKKDKAGVCSGGGDPKEALSCKDRISGWATSERMEVVWSGADMWTPDPVYIKNSQRDRPFYVVLASADCMPIREGATWRVHFTNGDGWWWSEFGTNEQGLNIMYIVFMCAYLILCAAQVYSRTIYEHTHHLPRLFTVSIVGQTFATVCFTIHYLSFTMTDPSDDLPSSDNVLGTTDSGRIFFKFCGELGLVFSKIIMLLLLLLLAQGWTILRGEVQFRRVIVAIIAAMFGVSSVMLVWGAFPASASTESEGNAGSALERDPTSLAFIYATKPGFVLAGVDLAAAGIFITCMFWTVKRAEELKRLGQRTFMLEVGVGFGAYLVLTPLIVVICSEAIDPWAREKWIRTVDMLLTLLAHSSMLFLIWPTRSEKHFLVAGNFNKAPSGGFVSPFADGGAGGLGEGLLEQEGSYGGF